MKTIFFDIGGVILTNGWDTASRNRTCKNFGIDQSAFETIHHEIVRPFETGELTLDQYLAQTVFTEPRAFSAADVKQFIYGESKILDDSLAWLKSIAKGGKYRFFTLNNESREIHEYRVKTFGLNQVFSAFLTSCYLHEMKPDAIIYEKGLAIASVAADQALFIDDRKNNIEAATAIGFNAHQYQGLDGLRAFLAAHGVN